MIDIKTFPKIDAHFHAASFDSSYIKWATQYNLRFLTINTDVDIFPPIPQQEQLAIQLQKLYPDCFSFATSFHMKNWEQPDFISHAIENIEKSRMQGAVALKLWKNIGMELKYPNGRFLRIDDEIFNPLFDYLSKTNFPMVAHIGEPLNCWLPLEKMTTIRNKTYFATYPQYHMYLHPEYPSYNTHIEARDNVLKNFPNLLFIGAHLGSIEWSYKELIKRFEQYPNFLVDCSSRMAHLQIQSISDYDGVRDFMIKYSDRIIYGTDTYNNMTRLESSIINDWQFLATNQKYSSNEFDDNYQGLCLPEESLYKIYFENAMNAYSTLKNHYSNQPVKY